MRSRQTLAPPKLRSPALRAKTLGAFSLLAFSLGARAQTAPLKARNAAPSVETRARAQQQPRPAALSAPQPSPAFAADDFIDSIGINGSPITTDNYEDGPYKDAGKTYDPQVFYDLGIRYYRQALKYDLTRADQPQQVAEAFRRSGARAMMLLDHNKVKPEEVAGLLHQYDARALVSVEGPNEPNNKFSPQNLDLKYKGQTDEAAAALYMDDVYAALKADPQLKNLPVIAYSAIFTDYNLAKGHDSFDFGNIHSYQGYNVPSSSLESNITRFNNIYPEGAVIKPFVPTETGYNIEADESNGTFKTGSPRAQALNIPMQLAEYFRHGIKRTYLFAIRNADGYGLVESDNVTKRPAYFALKNFLDQIREARWNPQTLQWEGARPFAPRSLNFTLGAAPATVHTLTLQKSSGEYNLLIWNEARNFDPDARKELRPAAVPVDIKFAAPIGTTAQILTQNDKGAYDTQISYLNNGVLNVNVPSSVMIIKLSPGAVLRIASPKAVGGLAGNATANQADLSWNAVPGAAGYFVFRNGWHINTVSEPRFSERTSWLRPGLGYTYEVQAFDRFGQMVPRAQTVLFTPNGRPDLVVTRVWAQRSEVGQAAELRATIKNIGDGPTPFETTNAVTFFVDGQYTSFGGSGEVLQPGEEREIKPDGGNLGWAPAKTGSYMVTAYADDINRVSGEKSETNNKADWTYVVGAPGKSELLLATEIAPGTVDLAREGARDWIAFGADNTPGKDALKIVKRRENAKLIGDLTEFGEGYLSSTAGSPLRIERPDGGSNAGLWWNGVGHGVKFGVPTSTAEQTLKLYVSGINGSQGKLQVSLSDGSAPALISTVFNGNRAGNGTPVPAGFVGVYVIKFRAAAGQTLDVSWSMENEPNQWAGQLRLQAITLN